MKIKKLYFFYGGKKGIKKKTMECLQQGADLLGIPTESCGNAKEFGQKNDYDFSSKNEYGVQLGYLPQRDRHIEKNFKKNLFFIERNIMLDYQNTTSTLNKRYYQICLGSIYHELSQKIKIPNDVLKAKQKDFYENFDIDISKKQTKGKNILILFNKPHGFGTHDINGDAIGWGLRKIRELRSAGFKNKIDIRFHPVTHAGVKEETLPKANQQSGNVHLLGGKVFYNVLKRDNYLCAIGYNTSALVTCFMEGIPTWVDCNTNILYKYSHIKKVSDINNLNINMNSKQKFLNEYINDIWSTEDMKKGLVWKTYLQN